MKLRRQLPLLFLVLALPLCARAQSVSTRYMKDSKQTAVETNLLYLLNTPEQFVEMQLRGFYKGETLVKMPDKVLISFWSVSKKALYRPAAQLNAVADGEQLKVGSEEPVSMTGETKDGKDIFYSDNRPGLGIQVPIPSTATVRNAKGVTGLAMEWITLDLKTEQLLKISAAKQAELHLGGTTLPLTEGQMSIIRDFASRLKPQP
jgi:hypothetical protein